MSKSRHIKNVKHALRKSRNRIRRLGDSWYSRESLVTQRRDIRKENKKLLTEI